MQAREQPAQVGVARAGRVDHRDLARRHRNALALAVEEGAGRAQGERDQLRARLLRERLGARARGAGRDHAVERGQRGLEHVGEREDFVELALAAQRRNRVADRHVQVDHRLRARGPRDLEHAPGGGKRNLRDLGRHDRGVLDHRAV